MHRRRTIRIPNVKILAKVSIPWHGLPKHAKAFAQSIIPNDGALNKKLGIKPGSKIFVFAGYAGDWSGSLAKNCEIHFTDLSPHNIELVRAKFGDQFAGYFTRNALYTHQRTKTKFDWSFSFEPYPTHNGQLQLSLVRSLLNKSGAKLVYSKSSAQYQRESSKVEGMLKALFEQGYGAKLSAKNAKVKGYKRDSNNLAVHEVTVVTLKTNRQARRRAVIDLEVLRGIRSFIKSNPRATINLKILLDRHYLQRLKIKPIELEESLQRLQKLSKNIDSHFYYYKRLSKRVAERRTKELKVVW